MEVGGHLDVLPGELVALDVPPEPAAVALLTDLWSRGVAFFPLDQHLSAPEKRSVLGRARPSVLVGTRGTSVFVEGAPIDERIGAVVATSGTAGEPRLAELPREALLDAIRVSDEHLGADPSMRWIACLSPAHVGGLLVYLRAAALGSPVEAHPDFEPAMLDGVGPAFASAVPTMVRRLIEANANLAGITLLVGGSALEPELRDAAAGLGASVVTTYGLTETCGGVAYDGLLLPGNEARIAEGGALELRGPTLMEGYRHDPAATAGAFTADGWLRTRDSARILDDGSLVIDGRLDDLINTGSEKVWPEEVERALLDHRKVAEIAIAGRPDPEWGERVSAWVVPSSIGDPPTLEELRAHASERVARFKAPRELFVVSEIPRTASGKVRRRALRP